MVLMNGVREKTAITIISACYLKLGNNGGILLFGK